jgi:predicted MPP superfamily phosphohydrolase
VYPWWTPTWARKYISGLATVNEMPLYVTRGIGMSWMPMRFLCPPEVTLITLRAGS